MNEGMTAAEKKEIREMMLDVVNGRFDLIDYKLLLLYLFLLL